MGLVPQLPWGGAITLDPTEFFKSIVFICQRQGNFGHFFLLFVCLFICFYFVLFCFATVFLKYVFNYFTCG